jgi:hypothetical protein
MVIAEFKSQANQEREHGVPVSLDPTCMPAFELGFINFNGRATFELLARTLPEMSDVLDILTDNTQIWESLRDSGEGNTVGSVPPEFVSRFGGCGAAAAGVRGEGVGGGGGGGGGATRRESRKVKKNVPPFALLGDPGSGKSSAVMAFIRRFQAIHGDAVVVIPHIVGATPSSTDLASLLFRIGSEVQRAIGVVEGEEDKVDKMDHDTLTAAKLWFAKTLQQAGERAHALGTRILVVIDSVDEMEVVHGALEMDWVPPSTHYCCQIMVSFTILEGHPSITALNRRDPPFETLIVGDLLPKERTLLATHFLAMNRKVCY